MRHAMVCRSGLWVVLIIGTASLGMAYEAVQPGPSGETPSAQAARFGEDPRDVIRVVSDAGRRRVWVLRAPNHVRVYDAASARLEREITLPFWFAVEVRFRGMPCPPALALDTRGSAYVSSNAQTKLWRIDGGTLALTEHDLVMRGAEHRDLGFGALAFTRKGTLYGATADGATLWRIDLVRNAAHRVGAYAASDPRCALDGEYVERMEQRRKAPSPPAG